jgi:heme/copper-type cytochrome/quinol oxidase subunit 4
MNFLSLSCSIIILTSCYSRSLYGTFETTKNQQDVFDVSAQDIIPECDASVSFTQQKGSKELQGATLRSNRTACGVELRGEPVLLTKAISIFVMAILVCLSPFWFNMLCADSKFPGIYTVLVFIYIGTLIQGTINYFQFIVADNHENRNTCSVVTAAIAILLSIYLLIGALVVTINDAIGQMPICTAFQSHQILSIENAYGNLLLGLPAFLQTFTFDPQILNAPDLSCCVRTNDRSTEEF